jgi:hypothetical protein
VGLLITVPPIAICITPSIRPGVGIRDEYPRA